MRAVVLGGPADGLRVSVVGVWRWIDPVSGRGFESPAPGRALYRRVGAGWEFAGMVAWFCGVCRALVSAPAPECPACGAERSADGIATHG